MGNVREATLTLKVDAAQAKAGLSDFTRNLTLTAAAVRATEAVTGKLIGTLGKLYLAYRGYEYVKQSVQAFAAFERQMAKVSTVLDQQTMRLLPGYTSQVRQMSIAMGEGTATLSDGLYEILQAMIPADKAMGVLTASAKAAAAGMTSTAVTVDAVTTILNSYGLSADQASKITSDLFESVRRGKMTFEDVAHSIGLVTSTAAQAGISLEELLAAYSTLTRAGVQPHFAITSLRAILSQFLSPTQEAVQAARSLDLALNSTTLSTIGLIGVLDKMKNASPEVVAAIIGQRRGLMGFMAALQNATGMVEDYDYILNKNGEDLVAYEKMMATPAKQFERFEQAMTAIKRAVGAVLAPTLADAASAIADWIGGNTERLTLMSAIVENEFDRIKDTVAAFVKYLRTDFSGASQLAWEAFLRIMEVAAQAAMDLAYRTGAGIWQRLREGVLGNGQADLQKRAREIYDAQTGGQVPLDAWTGDLTQAPYTMGDARAEARAEKSQEALAGFREEVAIWWKQAQAENQAGLTAAANTPAGSTFTHALDTINAAHDRRRAELNRQYDLQKGLEDWDKIVAWTNDQVAWIKGLYDTYMGKKPEPTRSTRPTGTEDLRPSDAARETIDNLELEYKLLFQTNEERAKAIAQDQLRADIAEKANQTKDKVHVAEQDIEAVNKAVAELEKAKRLTQTAHDIGDAFGRTFEDIILGAKSAGDAVKALLMDIARAVLHNQITGPLADAIGTGLSGLFKGTTAAKSHSGWSVGRAGISQMTVPAALFWTAPRLHDGLASDEYPAILQTGEKVLSRAQVAAAASPPAVTVNVINQSSAPVTAQVRHTRIDLRRMVVGVVLEDQQANGPISRAFRKS
jgi:TP901 family phage tail tape measure protein